MRNRLASSQRWFARRPKIVWSGMLLLLVLLALLLLLRPGKEVVLANCASCHAVACAAIGQRPVNRWQELAEAHSEHVPSLSDEQREAAFAYLAENFGADDPERYARCFVDGWYLTGDVARRDADGYFWFVGRADDVIKSAGHLIGPFEVESALLEHAAVAEAGAIGKPDPIIGDVVKAFVSLKPGHAATDDLPERD